MEGKVQTGVETSSDANVKDKNETQSVSGIPAIEISSQVSQKDNADVADSNIEFLNADPLSEAKNVSATKIASAWRNHRKSREKEGKILSAKSRDELKKSKDSGACMHLPEDDCPVWSRWVELLDTVEEHIRRNNMLSESPSTNRKLGLAMSVVERIAKGSVNMKNHLWLILDTEHWLEICDDNHRYGSNLKVYHDYWLHTKTPENFFYWLDKGDGKELNLDHCTREKLEDQQVKYLSVEERSDYEVTFRDGLLIYKKSEKPVHTNPPSIDMMSSHMSEASGNDTIGHAPSSPTGSINESEISHHAHNRTGSDANNGGLREKWIYVTDCLEKFYVGRKIKGHFHHSSFLAGGAICAAGGIKVRNGKLIGINPNSGHYKPAQHHFKALIERLRNQGVDVDGKEVNVTYPNDILEQHLMAKYKYKRLAELNMVCDAVVRDAEHMVNRQFDSVDRHVTKASYVIKKNMKSFLREGRESLREWMHVMSSEHRHHGKNLDQTHHEKNLDQTHHEKNLDRRPHEKNLNHNQSEIGRSQIGTETEGSNLSGSTHSNVQPAIEAHREEKIKGRHERKFSGFLQEILMGVSLFFASPLDRAGTSTGNAALVKKDNDEQHNERENGSVSLSSGGTV